MSDPANELRNTLRGVYAEIPADQAENEGWPARAMPSMLADLELPDVPVVAWFVCGLNPTYDTAQPSGWRYCRSLDEAGGPDLLGIAYGGPPPRIYLRADVSLPRVIRTLGHELYHIREFARGERIDPQSLILAARSRAATVMH